MGLSATIFPTLSPSCGVGCKLHCSEEAMLASASLCSIEFIEHDCHMPNLNTNLVSSVSID